MQPVRALYLSLAGLFFVLAVLGVFLPVLPTTPFLLLTSWCLVRSSPALHARLRRSPLFGPLLADWERHHGVRLYVKISALGQKRMTVPRRRVSPDAVSGASAAPIRYRCW